MGTQPSDRFPALLAAAAMGVYVLLLVGGTTAVTEATAACAAWPACGDGWTAPSTLLGGVAFAHRVAALVVGAIVVSAAVLAWRDGRTTRVRGALTAAALLYPVQAAIGALVATSTTDYTGAHLVLGMGIFVALVAALGWHLESETGDPNETPAAATSTPSTAQMQTDTTVEDDPAPAVGAARAALPESKFGRLRVTLGAYYGLMKPRLMWLLCLVAAAGMTLAGGTGLTVWTAVATLGGGVLAIGASGTLNHVFERDVDRKMSRTSDRPLATDIVPVRNALVFAAVLAVASLALFASVNWLAAALGLVAIVFYSVVYTLVLKPNTVQNTVIGGAAGALPALIGWVAVTGEVGWGGLLLATVIFLWTPAHFYNLALAYKDDYARGGFPMMPVVRGETVTRKHILWYLGATLVAAGALASFSSLGALYIGAGVIVGAVFLWAVVRLHYEQSEGAAFRAFHASNAYLGVLLLAVVLDSMVV